jgi:large subunit ribosomal protein L25
MSEVKVQRRDGGLEKTKIAGVVYGPEIKGSINIELDRLEAERLYAEAGTSNIIKLSVDGEKASRDVLIKGVAVHPMTGKITHLEFYHVPAGQKIEAEIELEFVGVAPAEKELGGVVNKNLSELPVKCFAADLVSSIQVDLSVLKTFDNVIKVADLKLPKGIEAKLSADVIVATVAEVKAEVETPKAATAVATPVAAPQAEKKDAAGK